MRKSVKIAILPLAILAVSFPSSFLGQSAQADETKPATAICPEIDCVPDERTAVLIGEAVLIPVYGEKHIKAERPFNARLEGERWIVSGSLPKPLRKGDIVVGGTAMVEINKKDGRILAVYHMK